MLLLTVESERGGDRGRCSRGHRPGRAVVASGCRVRALSHEEGYILYDLTIEDVDDQDAHREVVESLNAALG